MKRKLLVLTALLSLCVLLAACKKSDDTISTPASTATSSAGPEATPEPTLPPYEANVLTGEPKGADYPEGQRITSVMHTDQIVILEDGRAHAVGTHESLLAGDPIYQEIYASQMKGGEDHGVPATEC